MVVRLSKEQQELIGAKVASGLYGSPRDVIGDALLLLEERDRLQEKRHAELRREIALGVEELERGEGEPLDVEAIKRRGRELRRQGSAAEASTG